MDPYLEGYLWPDVHNSLAAKIRQTLVPHVRPKYAVRLNIYVVEDTSPESDMGIMYPDVELFSTEKIRLKEPEVGYGNNFTTPSSYILPIIEPVEVQIPVIEIYDTERNRLVTSIEVLSPVNKREPGLQAYRRKRRQLYESGVNLLEIDLLRRGVRVIPQTVPACHYLIALTRAGIKQTELWTQLLQFPLPIVPIPLLPEDKDVPLNLQKTVESVYEEAAYELSIDYSKPPPPPAMSESEATWVQKTTR